MMMMMERRRNGSLVSSYREDRRSHGKTKE
jgi:hypothetical protein